MAVYAIGDVQGCFEDLQALLALIEFDPARDYLWFVGDLVNRGPHSLETLRFVRNLGERAVTVIGNHDLHLLAMAHGVSLERDDHTLDTVLRAPDREELIDWLSARPLLHHDAGLGFTMVHAGLPPQWDLALAQSCAREVEEKLRGSQRKKLLKSMYGNQPKRWSNKLKGYDRLRFTINCLTRMRYCSAKGSLNLKSNGPPGSQKPGSMPWFEVPGRLSKNLNIVFGHWSTLGECNEPGVFPTDTGCLWGHALTALRLDGEPQYIRVPCREYRRPSKVKQAVITSMAL
jgi:bis(5'-nucleosyl)-tetraphosphatase (symmetrical)